MEISSDWFKHVASILSLSKSPAQRLPWVGVCPWGLRPNNETGLKLGREARATTTSAVNGHVRHIREGARSWGKRNNSFSTSPAYLRSTCLATKQGRRFSNIPSTRSTKSLPRKPAKKTTKKLEPSAMADFLNKAGAWIMANPKTSVAVGSGLTVVAAPVVVMAPVVGPVLGAIGFGSSGIFSVVKNLGSFAATAQAAVGNVVGGSLLAGLTSAGMGGYGAAAMSGAVQAAGGATAAGAAIKKGAEWFWSK
ncbi:hypothetical protein RB594_004173 [Gaeumannomyces avenae]